MAGAENEQISFVLKVLNEEATKKSLESAKATVKEMTESEKRWALEDERAARARVAAQQAVVAAQRTAEQQSRRLSEIQRTESARIMERIEGMKVAYQTMRVVFQGAYQAARALGEYSSDLGREYDELESSATGFMRALADGVARGGGFTDFINGLTGSFRDLAPAARSAGSDVSSFVGELRDWIGYFSGGRLGNAGAGTREGMVDALRRRSGTYLTPVGDDYDTGWGEMGEYANLPQSTQENLFYDEGTVLPGGQTTLPSGFLGNQGVRAGRGRTRTGGGGSRNTQTRITDEQMLQELERLGAGARDEASRQFYDDIYNNQTNVIEEIQLEEETRLAAFATMKAATDAQADLDREAHRMRLEWAAEEKAQQQAIRDYTREQVIGSVTAFASLAQTGGSVFSQLAAQQEQQIANITSVLQASGASQKAIESATKAHTDRLDRLKKAEGGFLIAYNTVMAATAVAQAATAYGEMRYDAMAAHITAAAGYAAAAVMAGVRLGDDGSGGGAASSAVGPGTPSFSSQAERSTPGENTSTNVTIFAWGTSNSQLGRSVERARWEYERSGGDADMLSGASGYDQ